MAHLLWEIWIWLKYNQTKFFFRFFWLQIFFRRQLNLHIDVQHRTNEKFTKFHSCAGIINSHSKATYQPSEISVYSKSNTLQSKNSSFISDDPSTNVVYYTSLESLSKKSVVNSLVQRVRSGFCYKWVPGTKIIHVWF